MGHALAAWDGHRDGMLCFVCHTLTFPGVETVSTAMPNQNSRGDDIFFYGLTRS